MLSALQPFVGAAAWAKLRKLKSKKLNKLMKKTSSVLGTPLEPLKLIMIRSVLQGLLKMKEMYFY